MKIREIVTLVGICELVENAIVAHWEGSTGLEWIVDVSTHVPHLQSKAPIVLWFCTCYPHARMPIVHKAIEISTVLDDLNVIFCTWFPRFVPVNYPQTHEVIHIRSPLIHILMLSTQGQWLNISVWLASRGGDSTARTTATHTRDVAARPVIQMSSTSYARSQSTLLLVVAFVVIEIERINEIAEER